MKSQLYLWDRYREYLKNRIRLYKNTFNDRIAPVFVDIEKQAEEMQEKLYNDFLNSESDGSIDAFDVAEWASDKGLQYYEDLSLMKYNSLAMWIAILYQFWEQQVRLFLFKEMRQCFKIEFKKFCFNIDEIKECFKIHNVEIEKLASWSKIDELRLLCNVIKHGDGRSAEDLKLKNPALFTREGIEHIDILDLCKTTLLENVLNINDDLFNSYVDNLMNFWDELPERAYSDDL